MKEEGESDLMTLSCLSTLLISKSRGSESDFLTESKGLAPPSYPLSLLKRVIFTFFFFFGIRSLLSIA